VKIDNALPLVNINVLRQLRDYILLRCAHGAGQVQRCTSDGTCFSMDLRSIDLNGCSNYPSGMDGRIDINLNLLLKIDINFDINFQEYHLLVAFVINFAQPISVVLGFCHRTSMRTSDVPSIYPRQDVSRSLCTTLHYVIPPAQPLMYLTHRMLHRREGMLVAIP
jgi:hypothetical protein